ncbi:MAG: hypothetical protein R2771_02675 [Saprospiraceae bacterium]
MDFRYWIRLLIKSGFIDDKMKLIEDLEEILRILGSIQKTLKEKIRNS